MGILIAAVILVFAGSIFGAYNWGEKNGAAEYKEKQEQAQAKIDEQAAVMVREANNKITDMQAAFEAGKEQAKVVTKTITIRGQSDVAKYPVFSNPVCVLPADSLQFLNRARANLRTAADPGIADAALPVTGPPPGREDSNSVPANAGGREPSGTLGTVRPKPRPVNRGGQVPR
jgi:hypothetical protein